MGNFIKAIFIVVGYFALTYINIHHPVPSAPPVNHSQSVTDHRIQASPGRSIALSSLTV
jgi:hypothetical protein